MFMYVRMGFASSVRDSDEVESDRSWIWTSSHSPAGAHM